MYRSYPPQPDIPHPRHLLPSAAPEAKVKKAERVLAKYLEGSNSTDSDVPLAEEVQKAGKDNSSCASVELVETLPAIPCGRRVVRKCKASLAKAARYVTQAFLASDV